MVQTMQTIFWLKPPKQQMKHTVRNVSQKKKKTVPTTTEEIWIL